MIRRPPRSTLFPSPPLFRPRAVEDALPHEPVEPFDRQMPPLDSAGEDYRACAEEVATVQVDLAGLGIDPVDRAGHEDLGAERSEEHTSGLPAPFKLLCRLLL